MSKKKKAIYWSVNHKTSEIKPVEIEEDAGDTVCIAGVTVPKQSKTRTIFTTRREAVLHVHHKYDDEIQRLVDELKDVCHRHHEFRKKYGIWPC